MSNLTLFRNLVFIILFNLSCIECYAGNRFTSSYSCADIGKVCSSGPATRIVDGFPVHRDCWEWSYEKVCNYPSKDNCKNYAQCYAVAQLDCLLKDSLSNCVNLKREFSCKSWDPVTLENQTARMDLTPKDGQDRLVCKGVPCIDGNCVDKSYMTNGEMMDSVSKLYATSKMQPDKNNKFNLFQGTGQHCSKKATSYSNCCAVSNKGWGSNFGAKCNSDEKHLMEQRAKNLCVYVGKENKSRLNVVVKRHFCCFPTMLDKVIQVEGRKQLGMNFGSGGKTNCRGLTIEEIQSLDFSKMDFTEFIEDFKLKFAGRYKAPKPGELAGTVQGSQAKLRRYDGNPNNQNNNMGGWHADVKDDSWEAEEEIRIERERLAELEKQRLARVEAERLEKEKMAKIEVELRERERALEVQRQARVKEQYRKDNFLKDEADERMHNLLLANTYISYRTFRDRRTQRWFRDQLPHWHAAGMVVTVAYENPLESPHRIATILRLNWSAF